MAGLLQVWGYVAASLFSLYVMFVFITPVLATIDNAVYTTMQDLPMGQDWMIIYLTWAPVLRDFFGYLTIACFIALLIYVIVSSARREPQEVVIPY